MPKLTVRFVENISRPDKGAVFYRDDELQGFGLVVNKGSMSYFAESRIAGKNRRVTIGRHGQPWTPESARKEARVILGKMSSGIDPVKEKEKLKTVSITLGQAFEEYMASKDFRPTTRYNYPRLMNKKLGDWLNKPVSAITKKMVENRFVQLSNGTALGTSGKADANLTMQILRATLNYISLKYEVEGEPLLTVNPVSRLTQTGSWHQLPQRQGTIPDHKLAAWYRAVNSLTNPIAREYYMVLILTGLRRNEAARLEWQDIDFESKVLTIRSIVAKNGHEQRLPLSDYLIELLKRRFEQQQNLPYVFGGYRRKGRYYGCYATLRKLREQCGCNFIIHDLRRTFLTMAEKLEVPHGVTKKLANHSNRTHLSTSKSSSSPLTLRLEFRPTYIDWGGTRTNTHSSVDEIW